MDCDYDIDVVAGSKARIAGYSAVQAHNSCMVWAYYMSGKEVGGKEGGQRESGKRGSVRKSR